MFYVIKLAKEAPISIIRTATPIELHNYKNRFIVQPPVEEQEPGVNPGCDCGCSHKPDELLFVNINCDLDLNEL